MIDNASYISTCRCLSCCVILIVLISVHRPDGVSQGWSRDRRLDICKPTAGAATEMRQYIEIALHSAAVRFRFYLNYAMFATAISADAFSDLGQHRLVVCLPRRLPARLAHRRHRARDGRNGKPPPPPPPPLPTPLITCSHVARA